MRRNTRSLAGQGGLYFITINEPGVVERRANIFPHCMRYPRFLIIFGAHETRLTAQFRRAFLDATTHLITRTLTHVCRLVASW